MAAAKRLGTGEHEALPDAFYADAFRASPIPYLITRLSDGEVVDASIAAARVLGHARDEMIGRTTIELGIWPSAAARERIRPLLERDGRVRSYEQQMRHQSGALIDTIANAEIVELAGEPHLLVAFEDVTERRRAEAARRTADERFRELAEGIHQVFWLAEPDLSKLHYVSPAYASIWGRPVDELYADARAWIASVHPGDRARVAAAAHGDRFPDFNQTYRIVRPDGAIRWISDRSWAIRDEAGRVVRVAGLAEDITDRHELEEQLHHTQKMESIGVLAGGVAHDFNNVLTIIMSCSEVLARTAALDDSARELIDEIVAATTRASALTRQLLSFSRREVTERRAVELDVTLAEVEKMLRRIVGEDIEVVTTLGARRSHVLVDPGHLVQVFMNLAVNARDAMPRGGTLRVGTSVREVGGALAHAHGVTPGRFAVLTMSDDGCGMSPEVKARVFEPFFTTKPADRGTGMGLAVVHAIVRQSGGFIVVQSEPGAGTTFELHFPIVDAEPARDARRPDAAGRGSETVMVVEDDAVLRRATVRILREHGYRVVDAPGVAEALELLRARATSVQLIITDVVMPGGDAGLLTREAGELAPGVPLLYTSGYTDDALARHGVAHEQVSFLPKPFATADLLRQVRAILDRRA